MFRRTKQEAEPAPVTVPDKGPGAKGKPTPSRKDAEAAARQRAKAPMDKKASREVMRERRIEANSRMRQAMRTGDERYLPARDKGKAKRFVRDFVDARLTIVELMFPLLVLILVLQYGGSATGHPKLVSFSAILMEVVLLVAIVDVTWMVFRVKRALRQALPDEETRGVGFYAVTRVINPRFMRQPKAQVRIGGAPK